VSDPVSPYFRSKDLKKGPSALYPFIETELVMKPLQRKIVYSRSCKEWNKCTILMQGSVMHLIPYDKAKWRLSIVYNGLDYAFCTGQDMDTDLFDGVARDITESEFFNLYPFLLRDVSFQQWLSAPNVLVAMEIPQLFRFFTKKKKEVHRYGMELAWECWLTQNATTFCCFKYKLPKSLLDHKTFIRLVEWDSQKWDAPYFFNSLSEERDLISIPIRSFSLFRPIICPSCFVPRQKEMFQSSYWLLDKGKCKLCDPG